MATFKSPLGSVTGKYGNLITYRVKGQNRVRSKPLVYNDANTPEQQLSRNRIRAITRFYSKLKTTEIVEIWRVAAIPTPWDRYTLFRKINTNVFLPNGQIGDLANLHLAKGILPQVLNMSLEIDTGDNITLTWKHHIEYTNIRDNDTLGIIALYDDRLFSPELIEGIHATRKDEKVTFHVNRHPGHLLHLYCFFASPERDAYSDDRYFKVTFE